MRTVVFFYSLLFTSLSPLKMHPVRSKKPPRLSSFIDRLALFLSISYLFFPRIFFYLVCPRLAGQGWAGNILGFFRTCVDKKPW